MMASTASAVASDPGISAERGWLSFEPSRYSAIALSILFQDRRYAPLMSSTVDADGMLMVLEIAPEMKGWTDAIISMWAFQAMERFPILPLGVAVSNTA